MEAKKDRWEPVTRGKDVYPYSHTLAKPERNRIAINALRAMSDAQRREILVDSAVDITTINYILGATTSKITTVGNIVYLINANSAWGSADKTRRINQVNRAVWSFEDED